MKNLKLSKAVKYFLCAVLVAFVLTGCKQKYYGYDLKKICEACEGKQGVSYMHSDLNTIVVRCNDGDLVRLK